MEPHERHLWYRRRDGVRRGGSRKLAGLAHEGGDGIVVGFVVG